MDKKLEELIAWKTGAWHDPNMVSWYAGRMLENEGTNRLKNAVETGLCEKFAVGPEVLDVGIGTGRASLPLLDKGWRLTGVDSSQAMLDECARHAKGKPIRLQVGDVRALPFPDSGFDTLISLNVMTHFPHWREVLSEWRRVVKPGGRMVFDIYSLDHLSFVEGRPVTVDDLLKNGPGNFSMHLAAEELFAYADEVGLRVRAIVPYGAFFSSQYRRFNVNGSLAGLKWWRRHMAWMAADEAFLDMAHFLEVNLFAALTSRTTGRFMLVLENEADPAANQALRGRMAELDRLLSGKVKLDALSLYLSLAADEWKDAFLGHMKPLRNRVVAYLLLTSFLGRPDALDFSSFFGDEMAAELDVWLKREAYDWTVHSLLMDWRGAPDLQSAVDREGLSVRRCVEYELTRAAVMNAGVIMAGDAK